MFEKKLFALVIFVFTIIVLNSPNAYACSCAPKPTVLDSFEGAELVVVTKLVSVEKVREKSGEYDGSYIESSKMLVEKVYKGNVKVGDELIFAQGGGADCIWTFDEEQVGDKFLFYLGKPSKGHPVFGKDEEMKDAQPMYYAITCDRSRGLEYATDDLSFLNNIEKLRGKTRISGTLDSWYEGSPDFANVKIKITGKNKTYWAQTDKNGFFEIYDLPTGEYIIEPDAPKGWKIDLLMSEYSSGYRNSDEDDNSLTKNQVPIILEAKKHAGLNLLFVFDTFIRGKVFSPTGKPMKDVCLKAVSTELKEGDYRGASGCTNEKGAYEITEISPGNYILVVNDDGKMDGDEPFGILFYPGVSDYKSAGVVSVEAGKYQNNFDIQISETVELVEISGKFLYSDGNPVAGEYIRFTPALTEKYDGVRFETGEQGRFSIKIPKGAGGKLFGDIYIYDTYYENCPEALKALEKTGKEFANIRTNEIEISGNENMANVKLSLPFPNCAKRKD